LITIFLPTKNFTFYLHGNVKIEFWSSKGNKWLKIKERSTKVQRSESQGQRAFVAKYANKPDVVQHDSGLIYRVLEQAQGPSPTMQNEVVVNQRILNFDGSVIADTYKSGFTDRFSLKEAILGLQEGLQLMALGSRYEFVIPPELALGNAE
jgi:FKBP-type peptidyl-prolyl cis-trans isomerase